MGRVSGWACSCAVSGRSMVTAVAVLAVVGVLGGPRAMAAESRSLERPVAHLERLAELGPSAGTSDEGPVFLTVTRHSAGQYYCYEVTFSRDRTQCSIDVDPRRLVSALINYEEYLAKEKDDRLTLRVRGDGGTMGASFDFRFAADGRLTRLEARAIHPFHIASYPEIEADFPKEHVPASSVPSGDGTIAEPLALLRRLSIAGKVPGSARGREVILGVDEHEMGTGTGSQFTYGIELSFPQDEGKARGWLGPFSGTAFRQAHVLQTTERTLEIEALDPLFGRAVRFLFECDEAGDLVRVTAHAKNLVGLPKLPLVASFGTERQREVFEALHGEER